MALGPDNLDEEHGTEYAGSKQQFIGGCYLRPGRSARRRGTADIIGIGRRATANATANCALWRAPAAGRMIMDSLVKIGVMSGGGAIAIALLTNRNTG